MRRPRSRHHPRGMAWSSPAEATGFSGEARLIVGDQVMDVVVHLDGHLEPLDGRFHWYGRIERSAAVDEVKGAGATTGLLVIGELPPAELRLAEHDPWGHVQVKGLGAPPYPMDSVEIDLPVSTVSPDR